MDKMITGNEIREICLPLKTFDVAKFEPHITVAELEYIKPILGKKFYNQIVEEYTAESYTGENETLHNDYLKKALAWFVVAKAAPFMHVELRNGGFFVNSSEFSNGASESQRAEIVTMALKNAEIYVDQLKEYIEDNASDFPLYYSTDNIENQTNIIGGIILDNEQ